MGIDFTGLDKLAETGINRQNREQKQPVNERLETKEYKTLFVEEKPAEGLEMGLKQLQKQADQRHREITRADAVYKEYQTNKVTTFQLQTEILKGTTAGEDITDLYLKAVKTISLLIHNELFYNQIAGEIARRGQ